MTTLYQPASPDAIDKCIARLAVAFQRQIDAATVKVYRDTMSDLPLWAIEAGELQLRRKGGTFFPSAPEWHAAAQQAITGREHEVMTTKPSAPDVYECQECRDTGWGEVDRDGKTVCLPCTCRQWNTTYRRNTISSRKFQERA